MRGSLRQRYEGTWSIIVDLGYEMMPDGRRKRRQKWITFRGSKKQAEAELAKLVGAVHANTFTEPSKVTLIEFLRSWVEQSVKPPMRRPSTYRLYRSIIETHVAPSRIALVPLQKLRSSDLERYLADVPGAASSVGVHHALLHKSLKRAVKDGLLEKSPCVDLERRRSTTDPAVEARRHCWDQFEARRFLEAAALQSAQVSAYLHLALDSGARRSELDGLSWEHLDMETGELTISRQLDRAGVEPTFGPTKTRKSRTLSLGPETIEQLRRHRQAQNELRMANRLHFTDHGLIFAKEYPDCQRPADGLGQPISTLAGSAFRRVVAAAGVKKIKAHGMRHTAATLSLQAGTPPHVVASRLGHSVQMLMTTYAHALPNQHRDAATRLAELLHGR